MADVVVTNIERYSKEGGRGTIKAVGNPTTPQGGWKWDCAQVIASLKNGTNTFFVWDGSAGRRYDIHIVTSENGEESLTTMDNGTVTKHLENLTEFPEITKSAQS